MRKVVIVMLGVVAFAVGTFGITHWLVYRSNAYAEAARYLRASNEVAAIVGEVRSTTLSWLDHTSVEQLEIDGKPSGSAQFTVFVEGTSGSIAVPTQLTLDERGWRVTSAVAGRNMPVAR